MENIVPKTLQNVKRKNFIQIVFFRLTFISTFSIRESKESESMDIINRLGGYKSVQEILANQGVNIKYGTLAQQSLRKSLTAEVAITLWDYCNKNGIKVKPEDIKGE